MSDTASAQKDCVVEVIVDLVAVAQSLSGVEYEGYLKTLELEPFLEV